MSLRNNNTRDIEFQAILKLIQNEKKGLKQPMKKPESPEPEQFKARLRNDNSFSPSSLHHFKHAYNLTPDKTATMSLAEFKKLVRHNGPIAVTYSNGVILIGHPYDF